MAVSMCFYYPLEHVAYAGWQMPQLVRVNANKVSAISCVFWTLYIIGDFWVSCLKWKELKKKLGDLREEFAEKKRNDDKGVIVSESFVFELIRIISVPFILTKPTH